MTPFHRAKRSREAGLTAVELVVTLAIISIMAAAAYPLIQNTLNVLKSKGAAEQVAGVVRQARQYAITTGQYYCLTFGSTPDIVYTIGPTTDPTASPCVISSTTTSGTIQTGAVMYPNNLSLGFDPIGVVKNQGTSTPYVVEIAVDTQPTSCLSTVGVSLYGGVRATKC